MEATKDRPKESVNALGDSSARFFYLGNSTILQIESAGVAIRKERRRNIDQNGYLAP